MKIRFRKNVLFRHAGDESVVCCPQTDKSIVLKNVQPFLEEIKPEWRDELDIDSALAGKFGCSLDEVAADTRMVFNELISQGFAESTYSTSFGQAVFDQSVSTLVNKCRRKEEG